MMNFPQKRKRKTKPQQVNPFYFIGGTVFTGVMIMIVFYGLVLIVSVNDMLHADCYAPDNASYVDVRGDVVAPSDVQVEVQVEGGTAACPQSLSYSQTLSRGGGAFGVSLPYFLGDSPVSVTFSADEYTTCSFEYNRTDRADMQFYVEVTDSWTITVTDMTLNPPRYVPHQQTFKC